MSKVGAGDCFSYMLRPHLRDYLEHEFGQHSVDRFASRNNVQVQSRSYYSKFFEQEAEGLDAFSCQWKFTRDGVLENNWVHPPYALAGRVIWHFLQCKAQGTLILPRWSSASWWPLLGSILPRLQHKSLPVGMCGEALMFPSDLPIPESLLPRGQLLAIRIRSYLRVNSIS